MEEREVAARLHRGPRSNRCDPVWIVENMQEVAMLEADADRRLGFACIAARKS